jgi:hypothetical protein
MTTDDNKESEVLQKMFDEIIRLIREKQIKLESIVQRMIDNDTMSEETFHRIYDALTEHGKKKLWRQSN